MSYASDALVDALEQKNKRLEKENAKLRDTTYAWRTVDRLSCENAKLREQVTQLQGDWESERDYADQMEAKEKMAVAENDKLREQMDLLVTLLRNDHDIDVSWDGLRKFWYIGLTEDGCLMRDRAYKAEAENAKLRELLTDYYNAPCVICNPWSGEHRCKHDECGNCLLATRALELGIEEDE